MLKMSKTSPKIEFSGVRKALGTCKKIHDVVSATFGKIP